MTTVPLPGLPKDKEFEEFLAAYFQCIGLYVQRNVIDRQEEEVLELDIIATSYSNNSKPDSILVEVKSGEWGFVDIFKIRG
jgi:predicted RecB family endonuclease